MAAQTIAQRVVVEGAGEIQRQFAQIGQAGDSAFKRIAEAGKRLRGAFVDQFTKELDRMDKTATTAGRNTTAAVANTRTAFGALTATFGEGGVRIGAAFGVIDARLAALGLTIGGLATAFKGLAVGSVESAAATQEGAAAAGISVNEYEKLAYAFGQGGIAGTDFQRVLTEGSKKLSEAQEKVKDLGGAFGTANKDIFNTGVRVYDVGKRVAEANKPAESLGFAFDFLKIKANDLKGLNLVEYFQLIAQRLEAAPDGADKVRAMFELFTRGGPQAINVLGSVQALNTAMNEAVQKGLTTTQQQQTMAQQADAALDQLALAWGAVKTQVGLAFAPFLTEQATRLEAWIVTNRQNLIDLATAISGQLKVALEGAVGIFRDFMHIMSGQQGPVQNAWLTGLVTEFGNLKKSIDDLKISAGDVFKFILGEINGFVAGVRSTVEEINKIAAAFNKIGSTAAKASGDGVFGTSVGGFARGGHVRGPGTSTSDSIFARLSAGEFVVRAAVVKKLGPAFFEALNGLRLPSLKGGMLGFTDGGLVPRMALPDLSGIGSGGGITGHPVHLHMPTGETFQLVAEDRVVAALGRFATKSHLRSAGRKPSWST